MLGVVRHDNGVRVPSPIRGKRLAVFRWIFGPSREAFSEDVPHKKCSFCGNPGGGPPIVGEWCVAVVSDMLLYWTLLLFYHHHPPR